MPEQNPASEPKKLPNLVRTMKRKWDRKPCGCLKADLPQSGRVMVRCERHRGKRSKRLLCHWEDGIVRLG